jgi:hypothetical protein
MTQWRVEVGTGWYGGYEPNDGGTAYEIAEWASHRSEQPVSVFHRLPWEKRWTKRHVVARFERGQEVDL